MGTKKITIKTATIPICDKCGKELSDGSIDFGGAQTFWGQYLEIGRAKSIEAKLDHSEYFRGIVHMSIGISISRDYYVLCDACAQKVVDFIKKGE